MSSMIAHLGHAVFLLLIRRLPSGDMGLQALVEINHAGYCVGNGEDDEDDCDNRCYKVSARVARAKLNFYETYQRLSNSS